jgi:uncharacterized protein
MGDAQSTTLDRPFHVMTKPTGAACNLECEYCYYLDKADLYPEMADSRMSEETLETFVKQYIEAFPGPEVTFAWQGGEPTLLGVEFFRTAVRLQEKHAPADTSVVNTIQTNGTRLDEEWCRFLADNDFLVGISIDGPPDLHDRYRTTRADGPTFDRVERGLSLLQDHGVEYNVLCVVNDCNSQHPLRVYDFFKDCGANWIQFIPLVEPVEEPADTNGTASAEDTSNAEVETYAEAVADDDGPPAGETDNAGSEERLAPGWADASIRDDAEDYREVVRAARAAPVTDRSVDPVQYGRFMARIFDEWVRNDVGEVSVRLFNQVLQVALGGEASLCIYRETCGDQVALEHNGDVYACDHYVEPGFRLGNLHETHLGSLLDSDQQREFGEYKRDGLPARCRECAVRRFCHGGCPKNRHLETPDGDLGLNYLCAGYRRFFSHVQPYLDIFEHVTDRGLPLAAVPDVVQARDRRERN